MNIPFKLNIFKQIEIYQELKELDRDFDEQVNVSTKDSAKECDGKYFKNSPTWFFEKKILYWMYARHKHLGSPLKISDLPTGEVSWDYIHKNDFDKIVDDCIKEIEIHKEKLDHIKCTEDEVRNIQIRKVFGNLEAKRLAKFFKKDENNYYNIHQDNCDGVIITQKGLDYAKMIYRLYEFKNSVDVDTDYGKIRGVKEVLKMRDRERSLMRTMVMILWIVIFYSVFLLILNANEKIAEFLVGFLRALGIIY